MQRSTLSPAPAPRTTGALALLPWLAALFAPLVLDPTAVGNLAYCLVWTFSAIGLAAMWGQAGILSFGQTAFFGLAGYAYGVVTLNAEESSLATWGGMLLGLALCALLAWLVGYMIFYGKIKGVFVGIVTLSITLVLETFMAQTAGPKWAIGLARLNGYNGMSGMPPLSVSWGGDQFTLEGNRFYYVVLALLALTFALVRMMLRSPFGLSLAAIRENPERAEMLGIDIRKYQLMIFVAGCVMGGLSGSLYTIWGSYITPASMGLTAAAMPVIWVATSGRRSIGAVTLGTAALVWLSQWLAVYGSQYALILMGAILLFVILVAPEGLLPSALRLLHHLRRGGPAAPGRAADTGSP
jgi:branched-chain amino acid transport system permease protein